VGTIGRSVFELGAASGPLLAINSTFNFGTNMTLLILL
jgi:hypothetical protein